MRVIAGKYRSRRLLSPKPGADLRPTSDRLRETLFDVISSSRPIENSRWLDLFSGTGAVAIEAISRGAREAVLVEISRGANALIRRNLSALEIDRKIRVMQSDVLPAIAKLQKDAGDQDSFDFVFVDPPYRMEDQYQRVLSALSESDLLNAESIVISEHSKHFDPAEQVGRLKCYRR